MNYRAYFVLIFIGRSNSVIMKPASIDYMYSIRNSKQDEYHQKYHYCEIQQGRHLL